MSPSLPLRESRGLRVRARGESHVGMVRKQNEDAYLIDDALGLYLVADGMGGHMGGAVASRMAADTMQALLGAESTLLARLRGDASEGARTEGAALVTRAIQEACRAIHERGRRDGDKRGMGTTLSAAVHVAGGVVLGHVGDSRIYLLRRGEAHRLTDDHTLAAAQVRAGIISKVEAAASPFRSILTRALGTHASVQVDTLYVDLAPGDVLLLCSDGLYGHVEDAAIASRVDGERTLQAGSELIALANGRGGKDNITIVMLACTDAVPLGKDGRPNKGETARLVENGREIAQPSVDARMAVVAGLPLFHHLDYREHVAVLSVASTRAVTAGTVLVEEGAASSDLFVILAGTVAVTRAGRPLAELTKGAHFGEMALVDASPRSATVVAKTPMELLVIGRAEMMGLMRKDPVLAVKILWTFVQGLSTRLRATSAEPMTLDHDAGHEAGHDPDAPRDTLPSPFTPTGDERFTPPSFRMGLS